MELDASGTSSAWSPVVTRRLTRQEHTVLALIAEGRSNVGIAERLGLTTRTVETHTSRIFTKLDLEAHPSIHRRVLAAMTYHQVGSELVGARATQVA